MFEYYAYRIFTAFLMAIFYTLVLFAFQPPPEGAIEKGVSYGSIILFFGLILFLLLNYNG